MGTQPYPERRRELIGGFNRLHQAIPETMKAFTSLHAAARQDGALSKATKELMALAISIAKGCEGCIAFHVHDALVAGATVEELEETVGVAVLMGGGTAAVYGAEALEAIAQFEADQSTQS